MVRISVLTPSVRPDGLKRVRDSLLNQTFKDFEWLVDINTTGKVDFNRSMNNMIRRAKGELIVSLQDYIKIPEYGLERFWEAHKSKPGFYTAPVSKDGKWDWRTERETAGWQEWEIDWGSAPRSYLFNIGGFDEELDKAWGFDNCAVGLKAKLADYNFYCLKDNKAEGIDHDKLEEHPFRKLRDVEFYNRRLDEIRRDLQIDYLS